jgi:hypothetical protein
MDEDGEKPVSLRDVKGLLAGGDSVRLYDLAGWQSQDAVEISLASQC